MRNLLKWASQRSLTTSCAVLCLLSAWGLAPVAQAQCVPKPSGIVAWWKAENNAVDSVGSNNGVLQNGATFAAGKVGQSVSFDGVNDGVKFPASATINVGTGNGFTVEAWINPTVLDGDSPIFEWNNGSYGVHLWNYLATGALFVNLVDTTGQNHIFNSADGVLTANTFQHIALTYDKTSGMATVYRNGVNVASQHVGIFTPQTGYDLYFGMRPGIGGYFQGLIDEPSLYSRALSAIEIQNIYNAGSGGKCDVLPRLVVSDPAPVNEGTASVPGSATFNVNLSFPITQPVTV
ncbi:MAG TPA: LamG domain-containing protein, partial [Abditibacteriaceae bacterium]